MVQVLLAAHLVIALIIIALIMLQQGKGAEAGASFGAGASQTMFGSAGSWNFFSRMTAVFATLFFVTSIALAVVAKNEAQVQDPYLPELEQIEIPESAPAEGEIPAIENTDALEIPVMEEPSIEENAPSGDAISEDVLEQATESEEIPVEGLPEAPQDQ